MKCGKGASLRLWDLERAYNQGSEFLHLKHRQAAGTTLPAENGQPIHGSLVGKGVKFPG